MSTTKFEWPALFPSSWAALPNSWGFVGAKFLMSAVDRKGEFAEYCMDAGYNSSKYLRVHLCDLEAKDLAGEKTLEAVSSGSASDVCICDSHRLFNEGCYCGALARERKRKAK